MWFWPENLNYGFFFHLFHYKKNTTLLVKTLVYRNYLTIFMFRHNGKIIGLNSFVFYSNVIIRKKYVSTTTSITIYHYYQMYYSLGIKQNIMELWTFTKNSNSINQKQTSKLNPRKKSRKFIFFQQEKNRIQTQTKLQKPFQTHTDIP